MDFACPACDTPHTNKKFGGMICKECNTRLLISTDGVIEQTENRAGLRPVAKGDRFRRACGHFENASHKDLCSLCTLRLKVQPCSGCQGRPIVMTPCKCHTTYTWNEAGRDVTIKCGYCSTPVLVWDAQKVMVGRWGKIEKVIGQTAEGEPIYEDKMIPFVKMVDGCQACQADYATMKRLVFAQKGENGLAFLPL